jgi:hypothetical protein
VSRQLITLDIHNSINAQATCALRTLSPGGVLPQLRSLGIHTRPSSSSFDLELPGSGWDEYTSYDNKGHLSTKARFIDASYVLSVFNAAPNLEELEMIGETLKEHDIVRSSHTNLERD